MVLDNYQQQQYDEVAQSKMSRPTVVRKKFAKPPVKVACLACRASRTRCDGQEPCSNCASKSRKCSYLPSKRGGPRKKKKASISPEETASQEGSRHPTITTAPRVDASGMFNHIDSFSMPGAGLRHLDFPSEVQNMFADFFVANDGGQHQVQVQMEPTPSPPTLPTQFMVRTYGSEHEILNAYYDFIHLYFPILPPRVSPPCADQPLDCAGSCPNSPSEEPVLLYRPRSPLSLAISAILSLVPHPNDPEPSSPGSVLLRRSYAHAFAQLASASVEADCELADSSTYPSNALSNQRLLINREPLHPQTPVDLENILALLILSVYEYAQRGNLLKMRYRASQALSLALDKSLHALGEEHDEFAEARRRAWWMTYYCVLQGSIVSTTPPAIVMNDPRFVTPYPCFTSDSEGWSILMQAQQVLVAATQFIVDLNKCVASRSNAHFIYERMQQLDAWASSLMAQSNLLPIVQQSIDCGDETESITAQSIRAISQIKISSAQIKTHRFRAFSDIPIFIKRHCDLTVAHSQNPELLEAAKTSKYQSGTGNLSCCSSMEPFLRGSPVEYAVSTPTSTPPDFHSMSQYQISTGFPFSTQHSAKVCLRAALVISRMFHSLPFPKPSVYPSAEDSRNPQTIRPEPRVQSQNQLPRTMPSFACCLMQSSYAMLMIYYKTRVAKQLSPDFDHDNTGSSSDRLTEELRQGLERIISAVRNYSGSFEALDGMRDEIEGAYQMAFHRV